MKVIDLLNKIANGEEVPTFRYLDRTLRYNKEEKWFDDINDISYCRTGFGCDELNYEVEVIEEDKNDNFTGMRVYQDGKEIYAIDDSGNFTCKDGVISDTLRGWFEDDEEDETIETINWKSCADNLNDVKDNIDDLVNKINEIIDKLNKGE